MENGQLRPYPAGPKEIFYESRCVKYHKTTRSFPQKASVSWHRTSIGLKSPRVKGFADTTDEFQSILKILRREESQVILEEMLPG